MAVSPITPEEVTEHIEPLPDEAIEIINEGIRWSWRDGEARLQRSNIAFSISERMGIKQSEVEWEILDMKRIRATYSDGWEVTEEMPNCWTDIVFRKAK